MKYKKSLWFCSALIPAALFLLVPAGCGVKVEEDKAPPIARIPDLTPKTTAPREETPVRLLQGQAGSVLILEEGEAEETGEAPEAKKRRPPTYDPFQDQHVKVYVKEVEPSLKEAVQTATSSGGQIINHPVKGFEKMGPNERILVFDIRTYRSFLKKLEAVGMVEYQEIVQSDFVTVRLTILKEEEALPSPEATPTPVARESAK